MEDEEAEPMTFEMAVKLALTNINKCLRSKTKRFNDASIANFRKANGKAVEVLQQHFGETETREEWLRNLEHFVSRTDDLELRLLGESTMEVVLHNESGDTPLALAAYQEILNLEEIVPVENVGEKQPRQEMETISPPKLDILQ
jgi:hypothetical protein